MTYTESWSSLSSYFDCARDGVLCMCGPVAAGDVLVVRGQRIPVKAVSGEGPFTVWLGPVRPSDHLPVGEPVRVLRPVVEGVPPVNDPAGQSKVELYAEARAGTAAWVRAMLAEAVESPNPFMAAAAGPLRMVAEMMEGYSPFTRSGPVPRGPSEGCREASFGWVHVRPGCRCVRRR